MTRFGSLLTIFSGVALFMCAANPVLAIEINYSTFGTFNCNGLANCTAVAQPTGNATVTVSDAQGNSSKLFFLSQSDDIFAEPGTSDFPAIFEAGVLTPSGKKAGNQFQTLLNQVSLDIRVFQSIPGPGISGHFIGELTGTVSVTPGAGTTSTASITFGTDPLTTPEITLNGLVYQLAENTYDLGVGGTPIQGTIDGPAVPEPGFAALTGMGFFGMLGIVWSRSKRRA